jgi:hypothetical protein
VKSEDTAGPNPAEETHAGPTPASITFNPFSVPILRIYGPYVRKFKRNQQQRRQIIFHLADGRTTSMSWARWLMTQRLGRRLLPSEHVDHVDDFALNDDPANHQILSPAENTRKAHAGNPSPSAGIERGWAHGTLYGWQNKGCLCAICLTAKQEWQVLRNARRRAEGVGVNRGSYTPLAVESPHGTRRRYRQGCPCADCREANAAAQRQRRSSGREVSGPNPGRGT